MFDTPIAPAPRRLPFMTRATYGFGSVAFGVKDNGFAYFLHFFYAQVLGLPAATVGLVIMVALILDALIDPVIGHLSDNHRSRLGRRHPFMYAAAVPVAITYLLLWNPPAGLSPTALIAYLLISIVLVRTFISGYEIPSSALAAELTSDYDERTRLLSYRFLFAWLGGIALYALAILVFLNPARPGGGQLNPAGYSQYGLVSAAVILVAILVSALGTQRLVADSRGLKRDTKTLAQSARLIVSTLRQRNFLFVLSGAFFNAMSVGLMLSVNLYFTTYFWQFTAPQIALLGVSSLIAAILAFVAAPRLSAQWSKKPGAIALVLLAAVANVTPVACRLFGWMPENGTSAVFWINFTSYVFGLTFAITASILMSSMIADVVDESELQTGRRQAGLFFSALAFVAKSVTGAGIFVTGLIVSAAAIPQGATSSAVPASATAALGYAYVPTILGLAIACVVLLLGYDITRARHREILDRLADRAGANPVSPLLPG